MSSSLLCLAHEGSFIQRYPIKGGEYVLKTAGTNPRTKHPISKKSIKLKSREENQDRQVTSSRLDSRKFQDVAAAGDA